MMRSAVIVVVLGALTFVPLLMKKAGLPEPYPAVLLPGGASKIQIDADQLIHSNLSLFAVMPDGEEHPLDNEHFLDPIPRIFLAYIAKREFGFKKRQPVSFGVGSLRFTVAPHRDPTAEELQDVAQWLASQLAKAGYPSASALRVSRSSYTRNLRDGTDKLIEVTDDFTIKVIP